MSQESLKDKDVEDKCFSDLVVLYINKMLPLMKPTIYDTYDNWPDDAPSCLNFKSRLKKHTVSERKSELELLKSSDSFNDNSASQRNLRGRRGSSFSSTTSGSEVFSTKQCNFKPQKKPDHTTSCKMKENCKAASRPKIKEKKKKKTFTLSESSSSEEEEEESLANENDKNRFDKLMMQIKEVPISLGANVSKNAATIEEKADSPKRVIENSENRVVNATNLQLVRKAFSNKNGDFDKCIQKFVNAYKLKQDKVPLQPLPAVIPPPIDDPSKRLLNKKRNKKKLVPPIKSDKPQHPEAHLGGIFTVNNGWDKSIQFDKPKVIVPREERVLPFIQIVTPNNDFMTETEEAHGNYQDFDINTQDTDLQVDCDQYEEYDVTTQPLSQDQEIEKELIIDANKYEKEEINNANNYDKDEDEISISADFADLDDLDDLTEEKPPENDKVEKATPKLMFYTELNDVRLKIGIEKLKPVIASPETTSPETDDEFIENTKKIEAFSVDPITDAIFQQVFNNICPGFLNNRCQLNDCTRFHGFVEQEHVLKYISTCSIPTRNSVYQVLQRFSQLFRSYMPSFTEIAVKFGSVNTLIQIVKDCSLHSRSISCLKVVVNIMVYRKYFNLEQAIRFVIEHHEESVAARDVIMNMIVDSGHLLPKFSTFIEDVFSKQMIPTSTFDKILENCILWQQPALPFFCLNYLVTITHSQVDQLNKQNLNKFIEMQKLDIQLNASREPKLICLGQRLLNSRNAQNSPY